MPDAIALLAKIVAVSANQNSEPDVMAAALEAIKNDARAFLIEHDKLPALDRTKAIQPVCEYCGSTDVSAEASTEWDREQQRWEVSAVYDKGHYCASCGGECRLADVPLSEIAECQDCGLEWRVKNLLDIEDIGERVEPGEPMPVGECPGDGCGALCHLVCEELRETATAESIANY